MDAAKEARFKALTAELAELLYSETDPKQVETIEGIEESVRGHFLERVGPELGIFLLQQAAAQRAAASASSTASLDS